jgi:hypothetical protein
MTDSTAASRRYHVPGSSAWHLATPPCGVILGYVNKHGVVGCAGMELRGSCSGSTG